MAIDIDKTAATRLLNESFLACSRNPVTDCNIKDTIDFVMNGRNCLTYRYIMFTALLAKSVEPAIDILSLQAGDVSVGAYDCRSLASKVVFPFQMSMLGNILDGSNNDPLVNKPGRFMRLSPDNPAASGDPKTALDRLCADLPTIQNAEESRSCIDYIVSLLLEKKRVRDAQQTQFNAVAQNASIFNTREFLSDLLDQGFGGASLVIVTSALYSLQFADERYRIVAHPVNQAGTSRRQFSDLDLFLDGEPYMGTELKDRPFSALDVTHAAETALNAGANSLLFIAGRQSTFAFQPPTYFALARETYAGRGLYVGVTSIDALIDTVFASHIDMDAAHVLDTVRETAESIGALEAQMWIYHRMANEETY